MKITLSPGHIAALDALAAEAARPLEPSKATIGRFQKRADCISADRCIDPEECAAIGACSLRGGTASGTDTKQVSGDRDDA